MKKIIIILTLLLLILIGAYYTIIVKNSTNENEVILSNILEENETNTDLIETNTKQLHKVDDRNEYYMIKNCVNKFYIYRVVEQDTVLEETEKELYAQNIYNMLDKEYIGAENITLDNLTSKIPPINDVKIGISKMYVSKQNDEISIYLVEGTLRDKSTGEISEYKIMLKANTKNRIFSIFLKDYIDEEYPNLQEGTTIDGTISLALEKNDNNIYGGQNISDEAYVRDLFDKYKDEILYNQELAYEHLDEEYRIKRFGTLENFKQYAKDNVRTNVTMEVEQYQKKDMGTYTQYTCIDQDGRYYIFRENAVMDYDLILDTYTIDIPEFVEKYSFADEEEKIILNIAKLEEAINDKNYQYIYSKLDETFRNNNYPTVETLKEYISQKLYEKNELGFVIDEKSGEVYICNLNIKNEEDANSPTVNLRLIIQLKEGTDYVISFSEI